MFCEEFQTTLLNEHFKVFDYHKNNSILFGELIWNFADFMTDQGKNNLLIFKVDVLFSTPPGMASVEAYSALMYEILSFNVVPKTYPKFAPIPNLWLLYSNKLAANPTKT